jgi:hypothetical protein
MFNLFVLTTGGKTRHLQEEESPHFAMRGLDARQKSTRGISRPFMVGAQETKDTDFRDGQRHQKWACCSPHSGVRAGVFFSSALSRKCTQNAGPSAR